MPFNHLFQKFSGLPQKHFSVILSDTFVGFSCLRPTFSTCRSNIDRNSRHVATTAKHLGRIENKTQTSLNGVENNTNSPSLLSSLWGKLANFKLSDLYVKTTYQKLKLSVSAARLYVCCAEYSDFNQFKSKFHLDDSFAAWCSVLQLHVWILMLRLKNHNLPLHNDFKFLTYHLNKSMWTDIENRAKKLATGSVRKDSMIVIGESYKALVLSLDEGYFTEDKILAGAVWRTILGKRLDVEPRDLVELVTYVHKNVKHLESVPDERLLDGYVSFIPLHSNHLDFDKENQVKKIIASI